MLVHLPEANGVAEAVGATHQQHGDLLRALWQLPGGRKWDLKPWPSPWKKVKLQTSSRFWDIFGYFWMGFLGVMYKMLGV